MSGLEIFGKREYERSRIEPTNESESNLRAFPAPLCLERHILCVTGTPGVVLDSRLDQDAPRDKKIITARNALGGPPGEDCWPIIHVNKLRPAFS
jgi:hypothetical protein